MMPCRIHLWKRLTFLCSQEKKKVHKRKMTVKSYHVGSIRPYSEEIMAESKAKLDELARIDKERMMLEEIRNTYESYIYLIKNKLSDFEDEIAAISTEEQREALLKSASEAEDWMYDEGYDADLETYKKKYEELSAPAEKVFFRMTEVSARDEAVQELTKKLDKVEALMEKWVTSMPQVTEEERGEVIAKVNEIRAWITEKTEAQAAADPTTDPVFTSAEVPLQTVDLQKIVGRLSKKPKPVPKKEEEKKNETETESEEKNEDSTESSDDKKSEDSDEAKKEEETKEEEKEGDEL